MSYGLLNRIDGKELEGVIIEVIKELNSGKETNSSYSTILTSIQMKRYFVTQFDLSETLKKMKNNNKLIMINTEHDYHYKLNPSMIGETN